MENITSVQELQPEAQPEAPSRTLVDIELDLLTARLEQTRKVIDLLVKYKAALDSIPGLRMSAYGSQQLDFDEPTMEQKFALLKVFGGTWTKSPNGGTLDYEQTVDDVRIRLWKAPPPASCKVIESQVYVPAREGYWTKKREVVCND